MQADKFFTAEEKKRIERSVLAAESKSRGEIVPMVVDASARYTEVELLGLLGGIIFGTLAAFLWADPWGSSLVHIWPLMGGIVAFLLCRVPLLKRNFLPKRRKVDAVTSRCLEAFSAEGLHYTKEHTGILLFVSLLEHEVRVMADQGINEKIEPVIWDAIVKILTTGLKSGNACDAFCQAIERCGEILATHFPGQSDDPNELPNRLVT